MNEQSKTILPLIASGALLAIASLFPQTGLGLMAAILSAAAFAWPVRHGAPTLLSFFLSGFVFTAIAFYWLPDTITFFGGFPYPVALLFFGLFCVVSALQFLVCGWLAVRLERTMLAGVGLALPLAWFAAEVLYPRMFPWAMGHAMSAWPEVASLAAFGGVPPISALLLWWGVALAELVHMLRAKQWRWPVPMAVAGATAMLVGVGYVRSAAVRAEVAAAPRVKVAIIQGNLEAKQKGDIKFLDVNIARYQAITREVVAQGAELVVWPESVSNYWTPETLASVRGTTYDPFPMGEVALLYGGLSFRERDPEEVEEVLRANPQLRTKRFIEQFRYHRFNSAFGLDADGKVVGRYHKRILMPFGEYVPLSGVFPVLKQMLPQTGDFTVGDVREPIPFSLGDIPVTAAVLICYEDLIPALAREAVELGANVLVNLTNDAWYGDTAAPYQHHLLALWRAIEAKRYLLRATNTGYTAIVNPLGENEGDLPLFKEGFLLQEIPLLEGRTFYSRIGEVPHWLLSAGLLGIGLLARKRSPHE
ncbi:MAG: apolipoprotein N-acyltransferase [Bdellovibrionales bacterium]|nr:apolipoprotein N-acyltransferase [Bdellovibrionales bacterium]